MASVNIAMIGYTSGCYAAMPRPLSAFLYLKHITKWNKALPFYLKAAFVSKNNPNRSNRKNVLGIGVGS